MLTGQATDGAAPLIYIDGVRIDGVDPSIALETLTPDDVESIEVIKGQAARNLFGDEATAGVIMIVTKAAAEVDGPLTAEPGRDETDRSELILHVGVDGLVVDESIAQRLGPRPSQ